MRHEWSYVRSEFVILEGGKNLYSGKLTIKLPACDELYSFLRELLCWQLHALEQRI